MGAQLMKEGIEILTIKPNNETHKIVEAGEQAEKIICKYADWLVNTWNTCLPSEGWSKPVEHVCDKRFSQIPKQKREGLCRSQKSTSDSQQPVHIIMLTRISFEKINTRSGELKYRSKIVTKRNDKCINSHSRTQLSGWQANCDLQIILDPYACI